MSRVLYTGFDHATETCKDRLNASKALQDPCVGHALWPECYAAASAEWLYKLIQEVVLETHGRSVLLHHEGDGSFLLKLHALKLVPA